MSDPVSELKARHQATWAAGDYPDVATYVAALGEQAAEAADIEPGMDVLDVATGTGNAALPAAERGADVTGLDLVPELLDVARRRADAAGLDIEWVQGDAEDLPFPDASFDRVMSAIGIQFAPRHAVVAGELARVTRPGGRLVLANWTAEGMIGQLFKIMGSAMPPPPSFAEPPPKWGMEDHVRSLLEPHGFDLRFERRTMRMEFPTARDYSDYFKERYGPTIMARKALGEAWDGVEARILELAEQHHDGTGVVQEYFLVVGEKAG